MPCENVSSGICGQWRPRSACASALSDQDLLLSANWITGYYRMYEWRAKARMILCTCAGWYESLHFAHVQRHFFAWCSPFCDPTGAFSERKLGLLHVNWNFQNIPGVSLGQSIGILLYRKWGIGSRCQYKIYVFVLQHTAKCFKEQINKHTARKVNVQKGKCTLQMKTSKNKEKGKLKIALPWWPYRTGWPEQTV